MEHLENHPHALLDSENKVIDCFLFDGHDEVLINQVKEFKGAAQALCCCDYGMAYVGGDFFEGKFYPVKPYPSWVRDVEIASWVAPVPMPETVGAWEWDESTVSWVEIPIPPAEEE